MSWKLGVDIGGTFIDFCAFEAETNRICTLKVLTTPGAPGQELGTGIRLLQDRHGVDPGQIDGFMHGTTVGINTIIQRKGAKLALVTNAGFEDVIELARLRMPQVYSLFCTRPEQLITRDMVFGIAGRMLSDGREETAPDLAALPGIVEAIRAKGADGVIVAMLHAYRDPSQEHAVKTELARLAPDLYAFTSAEVWPVIREYERTTTAILNGYVHPRIAGYLDGLYATLEDLGAPAQPLLTKSNGGLMRAEEGRTACVNMLLSGTASGVIGAAWLARQAGEDRILTLDIGGTSADLAVIIDGKPQFGTGEMIGDFPLHVPSVSVSSIGAGGGSIASVDGFGVLKVGPESAGSTPGPVCYGRGGTQPTITDAMAVMGILGHSDIAYGQLSMDVGAARAAIAPLAEAMGRSIEATAEAIVEIAISEMFVEVEKMAARYGIDMRDFTLVPFGGAGPLMGAFLAREIGCAKVMAPRRPGVVSALGGLVADLKSDFIRTVFEEVGPGAMPRLARALAELEAEGEAWLRQGQGFDGPALSQVTADLRYAGQSFELETALDPAWIAEGDDAAIAAAFHARHEEVYEFNDPGTPVELINLRLVKIGQRPGLETLPAPLTEAEAQPDRLIEVWLDGAWREVPLFLREALEAGYRFAGPAIVAQEDTTFAIPAGFAAKVDGHLNIMLEQEA
ncbi:hydantoinase/oxoprolinase family protein [Mangrovicoccus sp. HB161399]|uniref:hydantoinase/oxoprolinase family protein n=1 Tax=Mangrovicoccus sp. HB161399 TaxID=2720392 RepID=UPI00155213D9|nr:hydantoinase/oxoprolinase family protein [Mangrovicoccus sp. HB161399]